MIQTSPGLSDGSGVGEHADSSWNLGEVASRNDSGRLVVDADLEASGAPVDKLDGPLGLDGGNGRIDVLGDDVTTVEHAASHVLAVTRVALDHLVDRLKASVGDLGNRELLVVGLLSRDDWSVGNQGEVDPGIGDQVGLELGEVDIEGAVEAERGSDARDDLADQPVQVGVSRTVDVQVPAADVIDGLVVNHEGTVGVLQGGVGGQDRVVRLNHGSGDLRSGVDRELELGLLAVVNGQPLHEERGEARAGASSEGMEDEEALQTGALLGQLSDAVKNKVDDLLA